VISDKLRYNNFLRFAKLKKPQCITPLGDKMNIKDIKTLAKLLDESGLSAVEVKEGESTIRLERTIQSNTVIHNPQGYASTAPLLSYPVDDVAAAMAGKKDAPLDFNNLHELKAPIIGVFYSAPTPDSKPFVKKGDKVKKGDIVCIIEAMKVLNEIPADRDGEVVDICAENGQVVEYGQVLFKIH